MKFRSDDFPRSGKSDELADAVESEHQQRLMAVAEQRIRSGHHHEDGSPIELHEVGSKEFIKQSMGGNLEGKITGGNSDEWQQSQKLQNPQNAPKIEYEKKSSQGQPQQMYGAQHSVTGAQPHKQETFMMGCNCGAEWTVTGQSTKKDDSDPAAVKVERYGSTGSGGAGYNVASGAGGEKVEYRALGGQKSEYRG